MIATRGGAGAGMRQREASRARKRRSTAGRDGRGRARRSATVRGGHTGRRAHSDGRDEARPMRPMKSCVHSCSRTKFALGPPLRSYSLRASLKVRKLYESYHSVLLHYFLRGCLLTLMKYYDLVCMIYGHIGLCLNRQRPGAYRVALSLTIHACDRPG